MDREAALQQGRRLAESIAPALFHRVKPMQLGICEILSVGLSVEQTAQLREFISAYINSRPYLESVFFGTHRYDIEGYEVSEITPEEKLVVQQELALMRQNYQSLEQIKSIEDELY